jgi:hypothetical protein
VNGSRHEDKKLIEGVINKPFPTCCSKVWSNKIRFSLTSIRFLYNLKFKYIVTNGRIAWLIKTWVLYWTLDLFDTCCLQHLLKFAVTLSPIHTVTVYIALSLFHYYSLQSTITLWVFLVCRLSLVLGHRLSTADGELNICIYLNVKECSEVLRYLSTFPGHAAGTVGLIFCVPHTPVRKKADDIKNFSSPYFRYEKEPRFRKPTIFRLNLFHGRISTEN